MVHAYMNVTEEIKVMCRLYLDKDIEHRNGHNNSLWAVQPHCVAIIVYSVAIPIICFFGIIGNALIVAVLGKKSVTGSTFTYLTVLGASDLVTCALLFFSGLARGVFHCKAGWTEFDVFVHLPVGSVSSNITVWATVCVTADRLAIVCSSPRCKPPKFCDQQVARKLMSFTGFFAVVMNLPYCFIYTYNNRGDLITTRFFHSRWYHLQNWLQFLIFGLVPAFFLLVANAFMCQSVRKTLKQRHLLMLRCKTSRCANYLKDQARLTIMLVGVAFVFLVGELPTHLASRRSAVSLLYGGDVTRVQENFMEKFRICATLLNAIASSVNFALYCLLSRHFRLHMKKLFTGKSDVENGKTAHRAEVGEPQLEEVYATLDVM